jgi:hypothetical protein
MMKEKKEEGERGEARRNRKQRKRRKGRGRGGEVSMQIFPGPTVLLSLFVHGPTD